jgi:hypothetical protein
VVELEELYMLMGKELEKIQCAPAGTVFGIGAVEDIILKTATITTNPACPSFLPMTFGVQFTALRMSVQCSSELTWVPPVYSSTLSCAWRWKQKTYVRSGLLIFRSGACGSR